jgi:putative hydrolase
MDAIDWSAAQRIGELVAHTGGAGTLDAGVRAEAVEPRAHEFASRVSAYSGLPLNGELPALELVDRPSWIAANLQTMRPMLAPVSERLGDRGGPLSGPLRSVSGLVLGAQVGALTGMLSQRVLGQYDVALLDPGVPPRLLLLAPNLGQAASNLELDGEELLLWVTIHEITHAVQFTGAPWLRAHVGGMLSELLAGLQVALGGDGGSDTEQTAGNGSGPGPGWLPRLPDPNELRDMLDRARRGELLRLTLGEDRWRLVERMQATMSLIEGHAEHVMDAVGAEVLPTLPRLRAAMTRRRTQRGLPWRVLEKLLGLELKMRQYETGRRFCDAVVESGGPQALALVWSGPEALPSAEELEHPERWTARMTPAAA